MQGYFTISRELIPVEQPLLYDLYINSSGLEGTQRFVRVARVGQALSALDLTQFHEKYNQLYLSEAQRELFMQSLFKSGATRERGEFLKNSAVQYLEKIYRPDLTTAQLNETLVGCRDVVENMVDLLHDQNVDQVRGLIGSLSFHDFYTFDHSINVSMYSILIYRMIKPQATRQEILHAGLGGLLHDLGKIKIPTEIINNPGKLSPEQFDEIKRHPGYGSELLSQTTVQFPDDVDATIVERVVLEHHENFDGSGYPAKLKGEQIHLMARITSIADFFDAVTTKRSYHIPLTSGEALALMEKAAGKKIDPVIFEIFRKNCPSLPIHRGFQAQTLPADFDPCQPHAHLPLLQNFGKVLVMDDARPKPPAKKRAV